MTVASQVADDPALLDQMMGDLADAPRQYQPTNYWDVYQKRFLPELKTLGLRDFRRRRDSVLSSFGATDLAPRLAQVDLSRGRPFGHPLLRRIPGWPELLARWSRALNQSDRAVRLDLYDCTLDDLRRTAFLLAKLVGEQVGCVPLTELSVSTVGNPADAFTIDGRTYTHRALYYYLRYAYCSRFLDFGGVRTIVELGSGSGKQAEVLHALHSGISILLFDLPPQLYVCHQYLSAVFPDAVVPYAETRTLTAAPPLEPGRIYLFGSWQFPLLDQVPVDLFWNAVSFQEMEPDVVANYLAYVNRNASHAFLQQRMDGKSQAPRPGEPGVLAVTTLDHYRAGLRDFELVDLSPCQRPLGILEGYSDSFWRRGPA